MERKNNKQTFITLCVILVIGIGYIYQMAPSPVLGQLKDLSLIHISLTLRMMK